MLQEACLLGFKDEAFRAHLACCKWVLRIYRIIKRKRNPSITQEVTHRSPASLLLGCTSGFPRNQEDCQDPIMRITGDWRPCPCSVLPASVLRRWEPWAESVSFSADHARESMPYTLHARVRCCTLVPHATQLKY